MTLLFGLALAGILAAISWIDVRRHVIPDPLNLILGALGLAFAAVAGGGFPWAGLVGAGLALALLWGLRAGFRRVRGVTGLGLGDVKMGAAAATWVSPWNLPLVFGVACVAALGLVAALALFGRRPDPRTILPFGPFIGSGLMLTWLLEQSGFPTLVPHGV